MLVRYWLVAEHLGTRIHILGIVVGLGVMALGSSVAINAHTILHFIPIPHLVLDMLAYGIHGFGAIPVYRHGEHLWQMFTAEEVEAHCAALHAAVDNPAVEQVVEAGEREVV